MYLFNDQMTKKVMKKMKQLTLAAMWLYVHVHVALRSVIFACISLYRNSTLYILKIYMHSLTSIDEN